ncbi:MAG: hypothetical protein ACPGSD_16680 [Flavobacteriales bacterium]
MSYAQHQFKDLKYVDVANSYMGAKIGMNALSNVQLINKYCTRIDSCINVEESMTILGKWTTPNLDTITFYYTEAPSDDATFFAVRNHKIILEESGLIIHFKKNAVYIEGHVNSYFNVKRKFIPTQHGLEEVKQPFYSIGKKGKLNMPIKLFATQNFENKVAYLPKGHSVEILVVAYNEEWIGLLIKTEFGLVGWYDFTELIFGHPVIDSFYSHGD